MARPTGRDTSRPVIRRRRGDRGATFVEYSLFVALFVLIALAAVTQLNDGARDYYAKSSSRIGTPIAKRTHLDPTATTVFEPIELEDDSDGPTTTGVPGTTVVSPTTTVPPTVNVTLSVEKAKKSSWTSKVTATVGLTPSSAPKSGYTISIGYFYKSGQMYGSGTCTTGNTGTCSISAKLSNSSSTWKDSYWRVLNVYAPGWNGLTPSAAGWQG